MTIRTWTRRAIPLMLLTTVCTAACGSSDSTPSTTTNTPGDGTTTLAPERASPDTDGAAAPGPVTVVASFRRAVPPSDLVSGQAIGAVVVQALSDVWATWGPTAADAGPPPSIDPGERAVVVWDGGQGLIIDGLRVDGGSLVVFGTREVPGPDCITTDEAGGETVVVSTSDPEVVVGMPVADFQIVDVMGEC